MEESIATVLKETQIYSLSTKLPVKKTKLTYSKKERSGILKETGPGRHQTEFAENTILPAVSDIPFYIEGRNSILRIVLTVLQTAVTRPKNISGEIIVTYQSEMHLFQDYDALYKTWKSLISVALDHDWLVRYLYRVNGNIQRSLKLVNEIIDWAGYKNSFLPSFFTKYGIVNPPSEILVIQKTGGFMFFAANDEDNIDRAFFFKQEEAVESLYNHAMMLCRDTDPILKFFPTYWDLSEFLFFKYKQQSDYCAFSFDLHMYTIPLPLWEKCLMRTITDEETRNLHIRRISKLIRIFHDDVRKYKIRHICQIQALEYLLEWNDYLCLNCYQKPAPEDTLKHLNHTIYLLKTYENFEIALLGGNQSNILPLPVWEVKGGNVGITTLDMNDNSSFVSLAVTEETIAGAFHDYFLEIWDRISPKYREKEAVISWLEEQVSLYEKNMLIK